MDSETIGMIQQYLNKYVESGMPNYIKMWNGIKDNGLIDSQKSAIIGQIYGGALRLLANLNGFEEDSIDPYDLIDFNDFFNSRLVGIEKQIEKVLTN
ncbi:MAG: hypothetical protein NWF07_12550 [Candidatus Bathyarchaeota archaeon]|nr:hypothetical protein [Candidatus Bathyarchaeota archaeon]